MSEFSRFRDPSVPLTPLAAAQADKYSPVHDLWATHKRVQLLEAEATSSDLAVAALEQRTQSALASARISLAAQPTANDTITIGGDTYQFLALVSSVLTNAAYIGVARGVDAAAARANLVAAINGAATSSFGVTAGGSGAARNGTENVFAVEDGTSIVIVPADDVGGLSVWNSLPDIALSDALTAAVNWSVANLNLGAASLVRPAQVTEFQLTITAGMVSAGSHTVYVPVSDASTVLQLTVTDALGAPGTLAPDTVVYSQVGDLGKVVVTIGGTALADTDILRVRLLHP
jgi:hypothetical protein